MPVILAVNGAIESYQPRSDGRRPKARQEKPREEGADPEDFHPDQESALGSAMTVLAAQQAYGQTGTAAQRKPVVLAQDIMTRPVQTLRPETPLKDAWALMKEKGFRHLPITSAAGLLVGIVSDRDLLRVASLLESQTGAAVQHQPVSSIMTAKVLTATSTTDIHEVARVMVTERISALPVIDGAHQPIGIVTISDILRCVMLRAPVELWT